MHNLGFVELTPRLIRRNRYRASQTMRRNSQRGLDGNSDDIVQKGSEKRLF
jgi:hypothetical protein